MQNCFPPAKFSGSAPAVDVKVSAMQNAENAARKVVKMFKTTEKKTALLNSCIKEDVSSHGLLKIRPHMLH